MRFIVALVWAFVLVAVVNYVSGAIANIPFNLNDGIVISVVFAILVVIVGEILPSEETKDHA